MKLNTIPFLLSHYHALSLVIKIVVISSIFSIMSINLQTSTSFAYSPLPEEIIDHINLQEAIAKYKMDPVPASLEKMRGIHPRLFITEKEVIELRKKINTTHAHFWDEITRRAEKAIKSRPPAYQGDAVGRWGYEQGWQGEVAYTMAVLAMAYVITDDKRYLDGASEWALASCHYKTWGGLKWYDGIDNNSGKQLFGLGIVYDWCYKGLSDDAKRTIRETLIKRASAMFEAHATDKRWWPRSDIQNTCWCRWGRAYLQNHLWINAGGLGAAGLALFDETPDASSWVGFALDRFKNTMKSLGPDGASHEGLLYCSKYALHMFEFMYLARQLLDIDMFDNEWFRNFPMYRLYLSLPRNNWTSESNIVDIADCTRPEWNGDTLLRGIAKEYTNGYAQWLAGEIDKANPGDTNIPWINLLFYDPKVTEKPPNELPTMHHFKDMEIVSSRSNWSGGESLIVMKCGPYIGHHALVNVPYSRCSSQHVHPDANHFVLFGGGEWLIRDDGYSAKFTDQHNTLLIDGRGQMGEGVLWFDGNEQHRLKAAPYIIEAVSTPTYDQITGDATEAYPQSSGLKKFIRHLIFLKPDVLIVADEIVLDKNSEMELRFHPEQHHAERNGGTLVIKGNSVLLQADLLTSDGVIIKTGDIPEEDSDGGMGYNPLFTIQMTKKDTKWYNAVAFTWAENGSKPQKINLKKGKDEWSFSTDTHAITLNWKNHKTRLDY